MDFLAGCRRVARLTDGLWGCQEGSYADGLHGRAGRGGVAEKRRSDFNAPPTDRMTASGRAAANSAKVPRRASMIGTQSTNVPRYPTSSRRGRYRQRGWMASGLLKLPVNAGCAKGVERGLHAAQCDGHDKKVFRRYLLGEDRFRVCPALDGLRIAGSPWAEANAVRADGSCPTAVQSPGGQRCDADLPRRDRRPRRHRRQPLSATKNLWKPRDDAPDDIGIMRRCPGVQFSGFRQPVLHSAGVSYHGIKALSVRKNTV